MRLCEYVGIPSLFQGRVSGVGSIEPGGRSPYDPPPGKSADGDVTFKKEVSLTEILNGIKVPNPNTGVAGPKTDDSFEKYQKQAADAQKEAQKKLKDAESWRSNTPIASWTTTNPSGVVRTINVYGYNKEIGYVWLAEGPSSSAANSQLYPELVLASKSPEWVAWKSGSTSGFPLPLLLGAAYLLLA